MKKNIVIAILGTLIAVFIALLIVGIMTEEKTINVPYDYLEENVDFKTEFILGCIEDGESSYSSCECAYNELEKEYGIKGIWDLAFDYLLTEQFPERALKVIMKCV